MVIETDRPGSASGLPVTGHSTMNLSDPSVCCKWVFV